MLKQSLTIMGGELEQDDPLELEDVALRMFYTIQQHAGIHGNQHLFAINGCMQVSNSNQCLLDSKNIQHEHSLMCVVCSFTQAFPHTMEKDLMKLIRMTV